jgi:hypothetical protein
LNVNINENFDVKLKRRDAKPTPEEEPNKGRTSITSLSNSHPKTRATRYNFEKTRLKKENSFLMPVLVVLLIIGGGAGYQFVLKPKSGVINQGSVQLTPPLCKQTPTNKDCVQKCKDGDSLFCEAIGQRPPVRVEPPPTVKTYKTHFDTVPSGADIYLDNVFQGRTPMKIEVVTKGDLKVRFKKKGYFDIERSMLVNRDGLMIKENLQEEKYAVLIIDAFGAGGDYKIAINGDDKNSFKLKEEIRVPANQKLKVEVTNSIGLKSIEEVTVQENTRRTIEMVLKKVD